jgi:adenylate cyclase
MSVAFADLTGFTRLGEMVPPDELGALAQRFADLTADVVAPPVRLVKTIGDAVMLVSPDTDAMLETVLDLNNSADAEDSGLPPIHAGVARGPALARAGDFFGSAVNQASRIAQFARAGSVVASRDVREASQNGYGWSFVGRRRLKGMTEPVALFRVRRAGAEPEAEPA